MIIVWKLLGHHHLEAPRQGHILLDNLQITDEMMSNLELLPTDWTVTANGQAIDAAEAEVTSRPGEPVDLFLQLQSGFGTELAAHFKVDLSVHGLHPKDGCAAAVDMSQACLQTQRQSRVMTCPPDGGCVDFQTLLLPLVPGKFDVNVECRLSSPPATGTSSPQKSPSVVHLSKFPTFTVIVKA